MVKVALRMFEDSLCRCGHSMFLTQAEDAGLAYRAKTIICPACAEAEKARTKDPEAGQHTYIEDVRDRPEEMDPEKADDIMWFPDDESMLSMRAVSSAD
jgi:hypothetical protein